MKAADLTGLVAWGKARPWAALRGWLDFAWIAERKYNGTRASLHPAEPRVRMRRFE